MATATRQAPAKPFTKAYNQNNPTVQAWLNKHFPRNYTGISHTKGLEELGAYKGWFKTPQEAKALLQLMEEGRYVPEQIESQGLPENFGEFFHFISSSKGFLGLGGSNLAGTLGTRLSQGKPGEPPKGTPTSITSQGATERGENEAGEAVSKALEITGLSGIAKFFELFTETSTYIRLGKGIAGLVLIYLALKELAGTGPQRAASGAGKAAAAPFKAVANVTAPERYIAKQAVKRKAAQRAPKTAARVAVHSARRSQARKAIKARKKR